MPIEEIIVILVILSILISTGFLVFSLFLAKDKDLLRDIKFSKRSTLFYVFLIASFILVIFLILGLSISWKKKRE